MPKQLYRQPSVIVRSTNTFNLDNGSGTTVDEVLFDAGGRACRLLRAYALYQEATGTVASANFKLGTAVGGATLVAATAYENSKAIGDVTEGTILIGGYIPANEELWVRHTGVAATAVGTATIVVEVAFEE
jgi:hypothetical protein